MSSTAWFSDDEQAWFVDVTADKVTPTTPRFTLVDRDVETLHSTQINDLNDASAAQKQRCEQYVKALTSTLTTLRHVQDAQPDAPDFVAASIAAIESLLP